MQPAVQFRAALPVLILSLFLAGCRPITASQPAPTPAAPTEPATTVVETTAAASADPAPEQALEPAAITPGNPEIDGPYAAVERVVEFLNEGERVVGTLALPQGEGATPPHAVVLIFPGLTNTRNSLPITGTDENLYGRAARLLAENGIASLRLDFRGSGDSDGAWSDMTFSSQISDALAAIEYLATVPEVDVARLGLIGLSQGGLVAAETAARDERVDSVVLWSPVSNPPDTYKLLMGADTVEKGLTAPNPGVEVQLPWGDPFLMKSGFFRDLYAVNPVGAIAEVEAPLLVVVGLQDTTVTPQPYQGEAYLNYHEGPELLVQVDSDHVLSVISPAGPTILDDVVGWTLAWLEASL